MPDNPTHVLVAPPRSFYATRAAGAELRRDVIATAAADAVVVVDFTAVESATGGFIDELICGLAEARHVTVRGMNDTVAETVARQVDRRQLAGRVTGLRRPRAVPRTTAEIDKDITRLTTQARPNDISWYIALGQLWREMATAASRENQPGWVTFAAAYVADDCDSRARDVQTEQEGVVGP